MFTDIHTHAFHPKIARHAVEHLNEAYQLDCVGEGTIADMLLREKRSGIGRCVVLCAATTPGQVVPANDYAVTLQREHPEVTAFGTLHPGYEAWESQLERLKAAGIRGLKLHPDFQHFWLDDPRLLPMFEAAQDDFIFLFHIGDNVPPDKDVWDYLPDEELAYQYSPEVVHDSRSIIQVITGQSRLDKDFTVEAEPDDNGLAVLRLYPKDPSPQLVEALLWVDKGTKLIKKAQILDFYGNTNEVALTSLTPDASIKAGTFQFTPPQGITVENLMNQDAPERPLLQ